MNGDKNPILIPKPEYPLDYKEFTDSPTQEQNVGEELAQVEDLLSSEVDLQKVCIFAGGEYPRTRLSGCSVFTGMHRLLTCRIPRLVTRLLEPKRIVSCGLGWVGLGWDYRYWTDQ